MENFETKLEQFRALVESDTQARFIADGYTLAVHLPNTLCKLKIGGKYAKVDVGTAGKYMVELDTGRIFGIKGYGVIHRGHSYGTLDTTNEWNWGGYVAIRTMQVSA
jgi:hypothetical protein